MTYENDFSELVGKKIIGLYGDKYTIQFELENGTLEYTAEGDCCSTSWFEHIYGVDALIGKVVYSAYAINLDVLENQDRSEDLDDRKIKQYGYRLTTPKGFFEIDMRNESNGYYGGSISSPRELKLPTLPKIKEDF